MNAAALLAIVLAMILVRIGWGGRRSISVAGWALVIAALWVLTAKDGAWGLAMGGVVGMVAALLAVLYAGWTEPARAGRPPREPPSISLPRRSGDLARRIAVFVLVVPVAFAAAQWLAFGAQALARRNGSGDTDAVVLTFLLQPLLWSALMTWQMTRSGPAQMIAPPAIAALLGTLLWGLA